jgi:glutathione S-transferase
MSAMADLIFWTNPMSRGRIAHWMLEETGEPYETRWLEWGPQGSRSAEYLQVNPMGKVPALQHHGRVVTEAAAICLYLADVFPERGLKPGQESLAHYYRWMLFAAGPVEHAVTSKSLGWAAPPGREAMVGFGSFEAVVGALETHLRAHRFVCGDAFTAADVYVGSQVLWGLQFGTMPKLPAFEAYAARLRERPAHQRTDQINDSRLQSGSA